MYTSREKEKYNWTQQQASFLPSLSNSIYFYLGVLSSKLVGSFQEILYGGGGGWIGLEGVYSCTEISLQKFISNTDNHRNTEVGQPYLTISHPCLCQKRIPYAQCVYILRNNAHVCDERTRWYLHISITLKETTPPLYQEGQIL
jgi:hypothetical protein